ncbi:hypothetical protein [Catenulispora subtropica]
MVSFLTALVVVLTPLTLLNLTLLFAVIRRLRAAEAPTGPRPDHLDTLPVPKAGDLVAPFRAQTLDGTAVTDLDLGPADILMCLMPGCDPCKTQLAAVRATTPDRLLLLVFGISEEDPAALTLATSVHDLGRVLITSIDGPIGRALGGVGAFPTFLRVADGAIAAVAGTWAEIAATEPTAVGR